MLDEVLSVLRPEPGAVVVDCTLGAGGHAAALLERIKPDGFLIGLDFDAETLPQAQRRLESVGGKFRLHHGNFASLPTVLGRLQTPAVDLLLADLGMSSMQLDDAERGFSFMRDGPLDMRLDRTRQRTAADLLATISEEELSLALREIGDEPAADAVAQAIVARRAQIPFVRTNDLASVVLQAASLGFNSSSSRPTTPNRWNRQPVARTFQTLRILVNRELANLEFLLRTLPGILRPGGRAAIISFHSGEDRMVKKSFRENLRQGIYSDVSSEPILPSEEETLSNPRARSAKLRCCIRA